MTHAELLNTLAYLIEERDPELIDDLIKSMPDPKRPNDMEQAIDRLLTAVSSMCWDNDDMYMSAGYS